MTTKALREIHGQRAAVAFTAITAFGAAEALRAQQFDYSADLFPEDAGWRISQIVCAPDLWLEGGWFHQHVELCDGYPPPGGQTASYRRSMDDVLGIQSMYIEWRVVTDAPRAEIPWGGGAALSVTNNLAAYIVFVTADHAKLFRNSNLPVVFVDLEPGVPHTHRLELLTSGLYVWSIDSRIVDFGEPEGALTCCAPEIVWRAKAAWVGNTTSWDYIRYGALRETAPGDANCDGAINLFDIDPFVMALFDPVAFNTATPDCSLRSADLNGDLHVNFFDIDPFVECLLGACP